jgi:hypothetical protein
MYLRKRWINRQTYEYFAVNLGPPLGWRDPILIYQMGGVGSSSIRNSLFRCRDPRTRLVLMSHEFFGVKDRNPAEIDIEPEYEDHIIREIEQDRRSFAALTPLRKAGWLFRKKLYTERIYKAFVKPGRPLKVITLVREPVANNMSLFFQVVDRYTGANTQRVDFDIGELTQVFVDRYMHSRPLTWFDAELKRTLGIDVFKYPFPTDIGHTTISSGNIDLLVLRCELDDISKARAIADFVGLDEFEVARSNIAANKPYATRYAEFKERACLPESLLDELYTSKYARHFYADHELERCRAFWRHDRAGVGQQVG